jgi:hypothetical protein
MTDDTLGIPDWLQERGNFVPTLQEPMARHRWSALINRRSRA